MITRLEKKGNQTGLPAVTEVSSCMVVSCIPVILHTILVVIHEMSIATY